MKARIIRLSKNALGAARAHVRYIQRDGVQRDGSPGIVYSAGSEQVEGREFIERCSGDRHQFRLIVSPEDGDQYDELKPLVRRFMARMEKDLGTQLDWVAVDHADTGHPHSHVILRGKDDRDGNLVIAREYIARGMRERLSELLLTEDLGPRQNLEIRLEVGREASAERFRFIDRSFESENGSGNEWLRHRRLASGQGTDFVVAPGVLAALSHCDLFTAAARLSKELGLAFVSIADGEPVVGTLGAVSILNLGSSHS